MSALLRLSILSSVALLVSGTYLSIAANGGGRAISTAELWSIYGGATFEDSCCQTLAGCVNILPDCPDTGQKGVCNSSKVGGTLPGNNKSCTWVGPMGGYSCEEDGGHVCADGYFCKWDDIQQSCGVDSTSTWVFIAPDTCSDNCS